MRNYLFVFLFSLFCTYTFAAKADFGVSNGDSIKRPKIGLALGGGGAKGAAEVGVLKYIEEAGVHIDYIAGTSIGAIIGALYSVGYRAAALDSLFSSQEWLNLLTDRDSRRSRKFLAKRDSVTFLFGFPIIRNGQSTKTTSKTIGLSKGDSIVSLFSKMTMQQDSICFDSLPIPYRCVAVDLNSFEEVTLNNGYLPEAMRASMAIPGIFKPVEINGMRLLDGGLLNNLPVDVVRAMGADIVIAIDLTQNKHEKRKIKPLSNDATEKKKGNWKSLFSWLIERPDLDKYKSNVNNADIYINPNLKGFSATDFSSKKIAKIIQQGEEAGKASLEQLKQLCEQQQSLQQ